MSNVMKEELTVNKNDLSNLMFGNSSKPYDKAKNKFYYNNQLRTTKEQLANNMEKLAKYVLNPMFIRWKNYCKEKGIKTDNFYVNNTLRLQYVEGGASKSFHQYGLAADMSGTPISEFAQVAFKYYNEMKDKNDPNNNSLPLFSEVIYETNCGRSTWIHMALNGEGNDVTKKKETKLIALRFGGGGKSKNLPITTV